MRKLVSLYRSPGGKLDLNQVNSACELLEEGKVIAIPTDTIYGLAGKVDNSEALNKIYQIKGRDSAKPLSVCVSKNDDIESIAHINASQKVAIDMLLPGPVTIILDRLETLNKDLNPAMPKIGVRVVEHSFVMTLCHTVGPLALTSANKTGGLSPVTVEEFEDMWNEIDLVFDDGPIQSPTMIDCRLGSTVIDLTKPKKYKMVRRGQGANRTVSILTRLGYREIK